MNPPIAPISALLVLTLATLGGVPAMATKEVSEQEELACEVCHADPEKSAETLTDPGLYYQYMGTLTGYEQVLREFERCTYCHVETAGAKDLTAEGHRFRWMMDDMIGLQAWLDQYHPRSQEEEDPTEAK